jgi:hypothetical protein
MWQMRSSTAACALALAGALVWGTFAVHADQNQNDQGDQDGSSNSVTKVFVIAMENHNWTQPTSVTSPQQIFMNPAAPFLNSLVNGTSGISDQVAYANNYQAAMLGLHPSEPNYVWAESGQAFNSLGTDDDPYHSDCTDDTNIHSDQHLTAFLTKRQKSWKSYQEDANVNLTTNVPLAMASWTYPIFSHSGNFTLPGINSYNYATQFNYAAKHNPQIFFRDTNGGCPAALSTLYPPLQQLALDLQNNKVADYNWITPNQYNDQHSTLNNGYGGAPGTPFKDDRANIAQGDNFLARVVPLIMASDAYKKGAAILLWWDETEGGDTPQFVIPFIVISKNAHKNVGGLPYSNTIKYSHSSFLRTMQEIFNVDPSHGLPFLGDAVNATDLSALFAPGAINGNGGDD